MSNYIKQILSWWLEITIMKIDKEITPYNVEVIKNIQKSSQAIYQLRLIVECDLTDVLAAWVITNDNRSQRKHSCFKFK